MWKLRLVPGLQKLRKIRKVHPSFGVTRRFSLDLLSFHTLFYLRPVVVNDSTIPYPVWSSFQQQMRCTCPFLCLDRKAREGINLEDCSMSRNSVGTVWISWPRACEASNGGERCWLSSLSGAKAITIVLLMKTNIKSKGFMFLLLNHLCL